MYVHMYVHKQIVTTSNEFLTIDWTDGHPCGFNQLSVKSSALPTAPLVPEIH